MSGTHATRAYQHLKKKLIAGDFAPGTRLLYGPIGKEIGVSATPVREAAGQLANEGLVELVPQIGAIVRKIDREELVEIYEVREVIEPYAAALAADRATESQISEIASYVDRMAELTEQQREARSRYAKKRLASQFDYADYQFHHAIIEATANRALSRTASQSHVLTRVFGVRRHRYDVNTMEATTADHRRIFDAIASANPKAARKAAATHIRNGLATSLRGLDAVDETDG